jgi:hypothetical protein
MTKCHTLAVFVGPVFWDPVRQHLGIYVGGEVEKGGTLSVELRYYPIETTGRVRVSSPVSVQAMPMVKQGHAGGIMF